MSDLNNSRIIIGITGKIGAGKTTFANIVRKYYNFEELSFAGPLKDLAENIGFKHCYGTQTEKLLNDPVYKISARTFLQKFGTDVCRRIPEMIPEMQLNSQSIWVHAVERKIIENPTTNFIITDCRFPDEVAMLKRHGGKIIDIRVNNFIYGIEREVESEVEAEVESESETEAEDENREEDKTETESETETENKVEDEAESETETENKTETEAKTETENKTETEAKTETENKTETEAKTETENKTEAENEAESESETETETEYKTHASEMQNLDADYIFMNFMSGIGILEHRIQLFMKNKFNLSADLGDKTMQFVSVIVILMSISPILASLFNIYF